MCPQCAERLCEDVQNSSHRPNITFSYTAGISVLALNGPHYIPHEGVERDFFFGWGVSEWRIAISPKIPQDFPSCYHSSMRNLAVLFIHLLATLARLLGPGGVRSLVAESLLLKHQLLILNRSRQRSPNLSTSDRILAHHYRPGQPSGGPSWLTLLGHMKDSLWSMDLFRCESATLRTHWVLVVMDQYTRRIIGFGVQAGTVDGFAFCRMFNRALRGHRWLPKYLSSDNDPLYRFHQWQANLRVLEVTEIKSIPYVHRVAGGSRPPPAPTERSVRISRTTLFGSCFTAWR